MLNDTQSSFSLKVYQRATSKYHHGVAPAFKSLIIERTMYFTNSIENTMTYCSSWFETQILKLCDQTLQLKQLERNWADLE